MQNWSCSVSNLEFSEFSKMKHSLVVVRNFLESPEHAISEAILQNFARITPQYPGIRAPLDSAAQTAMLEALSPALSQWFGTRGGMWSMDAWYSLVTTPPAQLLPLQRFPHVDGTDPNQIAMMLYLHRTGHGGTAFFRHKSTGLEALSDESFKHYRSVLQHEVGEVGLPPAAYVTDGAPLFEVTHQTDGNFNEAVFYRGNILHSGVIDSSCALSPNPREGRLTINAFLRPPK